MDDMWKQFRIAVSFLTRLPLPYKGEWDEKSFSRAAVWYPLVGLITGAIVAAVVWLLQWLHFGGIAVVCGLIAAVVVSGGIHLDGFMDMCDGLFASRGRERALEIMKDSRVGSFAVIGIVLLLLLKYSLYFDLLYSAVMVPALLAAFVFSRFMLLCCMVAFPSAREEGLGVTVKRYLTRADLVWGVLLILAIFALWGGLYPLLIALLLSFFVIMGFAALVNRFLHGLTGDIYGAMAELGEAVFLLMTLICIAFCGYFNLPVTII